MASKDTGFHPQDADWTRGRAHAVADAESLARRQDGLTRPVSLKPAKEKAMTPYERDVLEEIAEPGSVKGLRAGAAIMVALECLQARGYVTRGPQPQITDKGQEALEGESHD